MVRPGHLFLRSARLAAGAVAFFGQRCVRTAIQSRSVQLFTSQSVPVVILRVVDKEFPQGYPLLRQYLEDHYQSVGATNFDGAQNGGGRYSLLVRRDRRANRVHPITGMPCF